MNNKTSKMIKISLLAAIAVVLMYFEFPVIPMFPWLKIDLSDIPALMGGFAFGPVAGIVIELLKNILHVLVKGTSSGLVGELANFLIGIALVVPASVIYRRKKTIASAIIGMIVGVLVLEVAGILANVYILLPLYGMKMVGEELTKYIVAGLVPFNGIKGLMVCVASFISYLALAKPAFGQEIMKK